LIGYDRGQVGVASAGKDTEGCQFFITHSPQPHLDGRYTIFATTVSGLDVADRIQVGDKIVSIRIKR
jgi:cyclophilin family peptidyl-prolyl cis-trans isomerase